MSSVPGHVLAFLLFANTPIELLQSRIQWTWNLPTWATVVLFILAATWIVAIYFREKTPAGRRIRLLLSIMRLTTVALILLMISQPVRQWYQQSRPRLVVLADHSESMDTIDVVAGDKELSRIQAWQDLLAASESSLIQDWQEHFELDVVTFDNGFQRVETGITLEDAFGSGKMGDSSHSGTRLGDAVHYALRELPGSLPAAIVVFTDGISNRGRSLQVAAEQARSLHVPLYAIALGSEQLRPDLMVEDLLVEDLVFPGDRLQVEAKLRAVSLAGGSANVKLKNRASGEILAQTMVEIPTAGASQTVRLSIRPEQPGTLPLELVVDPVPDEANLENNSVRQEIEVRDQRIRVLLVESSPSYEFRALKSLLERDPVVDLRVYLQEADPDFTEVDSTALRQFPAQASKLFSYDVVLLGDVDPRLLPRAVWSLLEEFVVEQGGGMACIAGPRNMPEAFQGNRSLELLLPFQVSGVNRSGPLNANSQASAIYPTVLGWQSPSLQLGRTSSESEVIWRNLPPVFWLLELDQVKPGAQVLAESPERSNRSGFRLPIILRHYVGAGEVLFHATDETWRWRWQSDDRYFARYWGQVVRRLGRGRLASGREGILLTSDRQRYRPADDVLLQVRFRDATLAPADDQGVVVRLQGQEGVAQERTLIRRLGMRGVFEATLQNLPADNYEVFLMHPEGNVEVPSCRFLVQSPPLELARVAVDRKALETATSITGGDVYSLADLEDLTRDLPKAQEVILGSQPPQPLWNSHLVLALFIVLLGSEWTLRRRYGML